MTQSKPWWITRRHDRRNKIEIKIKTASTYEKAVGIARKMYEKHGIEYGIQIHYMVPEIGELIQVRDYYLVCSVEDIV
jgi:hypothetical protein